MKADLPANANATQKFFESTKGQIILLLLDRERTVKELAGELDLTDNAVRAHLVALERDGLVRQEGERRSGGRPAYLYEVTPAADELFPKAYDLALSHLIHVLRERNGEAELEELLRETGRRAARDAGAAATEGDGKDGFEQRLEAAVELLRRMGGMPTVVRDNGALRIHNRSCLFSSVVPEHPEACLVAEGILESALGREVKGSCEPRDGGRQTCVFRVAEQDGS